MPKEQKPRPMPYTLEISDDDARAIHFSGMRYSWSSELIDAGIDVEGVHEIDEATAWRIAEAVEMELDINGGMFPLLNPESNLAHQLTNLIDKII